MGVSASCGRYCTLCAEMVWVGHGQATLTEGIDNPLSVYRIFSTSGLNWKDEGTVSNAMIFALRGSFGARLSSCRIADLPRPPLWIVQETYKDITHATPSLGSPSRWSSSALFSRAMWPIGQNSRSVGVRGVNHTVSAKSRSGSFSYNSVRLCLRYLIRTT